MKVIDIINKSDKTVFSFELLPPLKGNDTSKLYNTIESLIDFDPKYINLTTHRDEMMYKELVDGTIEKRVVRKRPGTVAIAAAIQHKFGIPVIPHILCGGFSKSETEHVLIDLNFLGINNVLALRGDGQKSDHVFKPDSNGHANASELVEQIVNLGKGKYMEEDLRNNTPLDFCIGVAGYPEKHFEAPNRKRDIQCLKAKVEAGADYVVTQMFFDNSDYYSFVSDCREAGITVPIIPGLKIISRDRQLSRLAKNFHISFPEALDDEIHDNPNHAHEIGMRWATAQAADLLNNGTKCIHFYIMEDTETAIEVIRAL